MGLGKNEIDYALDKQNFTLIRRKVDGKMCRKGYLHYTYFRRIMKKYRGQKDLNMRIIALRFITLSQPYVYRY